MELCHIQVNISNIPSRITFSESALKGNYRIFKQNQECQIYTYSEDFPLQDKFGTIPKAPTLQRKYRHNQALDATYLLTFCL